MNSKGLENMTLQEIKDLYKTLSNPVPVVGTGKNGCKVKQNWIEAVQKTEMKAEKPGLVELGFEPHLADPDVPCDNWLSMPIAEVYGKVSSWTVTFSGFFQNNRGKFITHIFICDYTLDKYWAHRLEAPVKHNDENTIQWANFALNAILENCVDPSRVKVSGITVPSAWGCPQKEDVQPKITEWEEIPEDEQIPFYDPDYRPDPEEELIDENGYRALSQREKIKLPISFGWTADRLLAGMKTVTRRTWQDSYAQIFVKAYQQGKLVPAFDKDRRYGGKAIGYLKLTCEPYKESILDMPNADVKAEGFPELTWSQFVNKFFPAKARAVRDGLGNKNDEIVWVIRFKFYPLETEIDDIPLIDETPKDTSHCELNIDQQMLLEKYKFEKIGHAFDDSPFVGRDPYCSLNGWDCYFSYNNSRPQKMTLLSLVNYHKNEWWGARLDCYSTTKNREQVKRYAQRIILELSLRLKQKTGVKT